MNSCADVPDGRRAREDRDHGAAAQAGTGHLSGSRLRVCRSRPRPGGWRTSAAGRRRLWPATCGRSTLPFYLPQREHRVRRAGGSFVSFLPLFPGYLFFRGSAADRLAALRSDLIVKVLDVPNQDLLAEELAQLHALQQSGASLAAVRSARAGRRGPHRRGPVQGLYGNRPARRRTAAPGRLDFHLAESRLRRAREGRRGAPSPAAGAARRDVRSAVANSRSGDRRFTNHGRSPSVSVHRRGRSPPERDCRSEKRNTRRSDQMTSSSRVPVANRRGIRTMRTARRLRPRRRALRRKIEDRTARVGVIGLGYVGLPMTLTMAEKGYSVLGFDIDPTKIEALNHGRNYIQHLDGRRLDRGGRRREVPRDRGLSAPEGAGRPPDLRADAADAAARARHELRRRDGAADPGVPAAGAARRSRVDDLPGHDRRARAGHPRRDRA